MSAACPNGKGVTSRTGGLRPSKVCPGVAKPIGGGSDQYTMWSKVWAERRIEYGNTIFQKGDELMVTGIDRTDPKCILVVPYSRKPSSGTGGVWVTKDDVSKNPQK